MVLGSAGRNIPSNCWDGILAMISGVFRTTRYVLVFTAVVLWLCWCLAREPTGDGDTNRETLDCFLSVTALRINNIHFNCKCPFMQHIKPNNSSRSWPYYIHIISCAKRNSIHISIFVRSLRFPKFKQYYQLGLIQASIIFDSLPWASNSLQYVPFDLLECVN